MEFIDEADIINEPFNVVDKFHCYVEAGVLLPEGYYSCVKTYKKEIFAFIGEGWTEII